MKVSDVMTPNPNCVEATTAINEAARALFELDVRHLPVVEDGKLVGILSDRDFLEARSEGDDVLGQNFLADERQARSIMRSTPYSTTPDTDLTELIDLILEQKLSAVPVIDAAQSVVGIISYIDILKKARDIL